MIKGIGHIGIAVRDIEKSLHAASKALGVPMPEVLENREKQIKFAVLQLGAVALEFLQEERENGEFATLARERGDAIHHICLLSDEIEADAACMRDRGVELAFGKPVVGLRGKRILFTKASALNGIPIELSEP